MNNFAEKLSSLQDKMIEDENMLGMIPDENNFNNPENLKLVKSVFGSYQDDAAYIFNILIADMDGDPGEMAKEYDIKSVEEFVKYFKPALKEEGYSF